MLAFNKGKRKMRLLNLNDLQFFSSGFIVLFITLILYTLGKWFIFNFLKEKQLFIFFLFSFASILGFSTIRRNNKEAPELNRIIFTFHVSSKETSKMLLQIMMSQFESIIYCDKDLMLWNLNCIVFFSPFKKKIILLISLNFPNKSVLHFTDNKTKWFDKIILT